MKKIILIISIILLVVIALVTGIFLYFYSPFLQENMAIDVQVKDGRTKVVNESFGFEFEIAENCHIEPLYTHYWPFHSDLRWSGYLFCDNLEHYPVDIAAYEGVANSLGKFDALQSSEKIFSGQIGGDLTILTIADPKNEKKFEIVANPRNRELWEEIKESIREM